MGTKEKYAETEMQMREHFACYEASGSTVEEYCKANGLSVHKFNYWRYRGLKKQVIPGRPQSGFSRVRSAASAIAVPESFSHMPTVQVTLTNGTRVEFFESNSIDLFKALL